MVRFGKHGRHNQALTFWGRLGYFIHGTPHIVKFMEQHYFVNLTRTIMSTNIKKVLDIGCGNGDYAFYLAEQYPWLAIDALDVSKESIDYACTIQKINKLTNIRFINADFSKHPRDTKYDFIYCVQALHTIADKQLFLKNVASILSENGVFYFQDCIDSSYAHTLLGREPATFQQYRTHFFKGEQLTEQKILNLFKKLKLTVINKRNIVGFFGRLSWELSQFFQDSNQKYLVTFTTPFLKLLCLLEFLFPFGRKNEVIIIIKTHT